MKTQAILTQVIVCAVMLAIGFGLDTSVPYFVAGFAAGLAFALWYD